MDSIAFYFDWEEEDEAQSSKIIRRRIRHTAENLMELPDWEFKKNFRLNKSAFIYVLEELKSAIPPAVRSTSVTLECKLAACLRFFAEGGYQRGTGKDYNVAIAQSTFSQHLKEILDILERKLCPKWIKLAMTEEEKQEAKRYFYERSGIPGVIMCVDGTHIKIFKPTESPHLFYNRKGFFSLNAMIICDHKQRIRYIDAKHPGASHDSFIWNSSDAAKYFEDNYRSGERNTRLLGDAGYPLQPWMLTPFRSAAEGTAQRRFNKSLSTARSEVERTIGVLKNRFRCLLGARQLHYSPQKAVQIINVCCALHNICIYHNIASEDLQLGGDETAETSDFFTNDEVTPSLYAAEANDIRNVILQNF